MKKSLLALLSVFILLFTACDTWMQDDDFFADIESDVKVANAPQISVYVRYALTRQGKTDPDGPATFKVEIPQEVSATTETEYGFVRWAAFTTDFIATGDNQSKNKDIYFIDEEDYNSRLLPHEIKAPAVVFEKPTSATTKVTINENRNDLFLVPIVAQRPAVSLTIPAKGSSGVVRNMSVRINFTKPMDEASFKNEAGEFDKITVTQGIQSFTADGDIEINSEDITDYFEAPVFSKNKKMLTLKFKPERLSEGYSSQSSVNITISKDVKDIYGFAMTDDDKISFSVGSYKDTLAPRITQLSAGRTGSDFHRFLGVYKDAGTINSVGAATKMTLEGAANAPLNDIDASFYDTYIPYRVTDKVILRVLAEDISGSGSGQSQTGIETDVAMVGMRAYHMYNSDGSTSTFTYTPATADTAAQAFKFLAVNYQPQMNLTTSVPGAYKTLIQAVNERIEGTENDFAFDKGCLLEMDVSDLPDGLIRIDVAAVDMVQNSGFSDGGALSEEYGNAWASLFVIKDTTPPDASANSSFVSVDTSASTLITADHYFNEATYSNVKIAHDLSSLADAGHARLRSPHDSLKWIVKPTAETNWISTINASNAAWLPVTSDYAPFPLPTNQGEVHYTYALMDDVGNISAASAIPPIYYDSVAPVVGNLSFVADEGYTAGVAKDNILDEQTLIIPITEETSGLKSIEVKVRKAGAAEDYASPLSYSGLVVTTAGQAVPYTLDEAKKVLTFTTPQTNFNSDVRIKGIKLSDDLGEQGSFEVNVVVKDAAAAASVHEIQPAVKAISNTDSVPVVIDQIYIPNLKETVRHGGTTPEYWVDYTSTNAQALTKPAGANPRTDVYIKFTEATSGARIFDFAGSSMHLTADSMIYKINEADGAIIGGTAIAATPDLANNRLLINSAADAAANFAGGQMTVKITQVELASEGTASTIALKIHDTATNPSEVNGTIRSNEGGLSLASPAIEVSAAGFRFDTATPSAQTPHGSLADRDNTEVASTATEASGKTAAESGYTNEVYVNQTIYLTPTASGIEGLTIVGDASFDSSTTITEGAGSSVYYDIISADNKTVRFKKGGDGTDANSHVVLGAGTTVTLTIHNLKLTAGDGTSGDGTKTVTVKPAGFGGVKDATGSSDYIILDRQPPVWNSANTGLYTTTDKSVLDGHVYPHPSASPYGIPGSQVLNATDTSALYFYRKADISIRPDVIDDNKKSDETLITYTHADAALTNSAAYLYTTETGTFTATATDRAGNKSTIKTFNIVADSSFANSSDELTAIDNYMTLYKPEGAFIHRNTAASGTAKYVIKRDAQYQIRVKLGGNAQVTGEESINGSTPSYTSGTAYARKDNKIDSSGIEKYYISTSSTPPAYNSTAWVLYNPAVTGSFVGGIVSTSVDSNGTIIINLPSENCSPLVLHLMDSCGNFTSRNIRPVSASYNVTWEVDRQVASEEENLTGTPSITAGSSSITQCSDVSFYNNTVTLKIDELTESCRFDTPSFPTYSTDSSFAYSLKSRIIAWTETTIPENFRDYFGNNDGTSYKTGITPPPASSDWCFVKQANSGDNLVFYVQNNFPEYSATNRYRLYLILEDTVGNFEIRQIRQASDGSIVVSKSAPASTDVEYWLYDNTAPTVENFTYAKVNTVAVDSINYNYYSDNSTVTYNIYDAGSGIRNAGNGNSNYTNFASRRTGSSTNPESETKKLISAHGTTDSGSHTLSINDIKDYAGNTRATTENPIPLSYNSVSNWIKQSSAPTLTEVNETHENNAWAVKTSLLGAVTPTLSPDDDTGGQILSIKAKARTTSLNVSLYVEDSTQLLGWYISDEALTFTGSDATGKDFYSATELADNNTAQGFSINYSSGAYVISYDKGFLNYTAWHLHDTFKNAKYYYPVNRAGLIAHTPVKVEFTTNNQPAIVGGEDGFTYSSKISIEDPSYLAAPKPDTPYTIKYSSTINYTRGVKTDTATETPYATITFTTSDGPTSCKFLYGPGNNGEWGDDDDVAGSPIELTPDSGTTSTYTIPLVSSELQEHTASASGTALRLQLSRGTEEDSVVYEIKGPANNNLWVYDNETPTVSYSNLKTKDKPTTTPGSFADAIPAESSVSTDLTKYIQSAWAKLTLTAKYSTEDGTDVVATDIARRQWRWSEDGGTTYNSWRDISDVLTDPNDMNPTLSGSTLVFDAPAKKTTIEFRVIDTAGNISSSTTAFTLQRDDAAPTGTLTYSTKNNSPDPNNLVAKGTDTELATNSRQIKYSSNATSGYYINKIDLDLSNITDSITSGEDTISKAGIKYFQVIKKRFTNAALTQTTEGSTINIWNRSSLPSDAVTGDVLFASDKHYQIDLSDNTDGEYYQYTIKVVDNIGQINTLYTFRTQSDNVAPGLPQPAEADIQATEADGSGTASNSVKYNGIFYLKNDRAVVNFTTTAALYDKDAHYRWSNDNTHWYEYNATSAVWEQYTFNDSNSTFVKTTPEVTLPGSTASLSLNDDEHKISFSFAAPDTATIYYFMAEDLVGNPVIRGDSSGDNCIKLQKDKWAPDVPSTENGGLIAYSLYNGENPKTALTAPDSTNLITETAKTDSTPASVEIKYSSNSTASSNNYIDKMIIDLSKVFDNVTAEGVVSGTGIARSGIENFYVSINDGTYNSIDSITETDFSYSTSTKKITLTLPANSNTQKTYSIKVKDNIGEEKLLRTFTLKPDGVKPDLTLNTTTPVQAVTGDTAGTTYQNGTSPYYISGTHAKINFTKTATNTISKYEMKLSTADTWSNIELTDTNLEIANDTVSYTLPAPATEPATYQFRAIDAVGNISEVQSISLIQDITEPAGDVPEESIKYDNTDITTGFVRTVTEGTPTDKTIIFNSNTINKITVDVSAIKTANDGTYGSGIAGFYFNDAEITATSETATISNDGVISIALADTLNNTTYTLTVKDNVGKTRTIYTFHLTADGDAPNFTLSSVQTRGTGSTYDVTAIGTGDDSVYYLCRANAILTFATTTPTDIDHYEWDNGTGTYITTTPITLTDMVYTFVAPEPAETTNAPTTYKFKAVDKVGNATEITPIKLVHDETGPTGTITGISLNDQDGNAFTDTSYYIATTPADSTTTTILFNSNQVKSITFTDSGSDNNGGSGYDNTALWYEVGNGNTTAMTDKTLPLGTDLNGVTYHIYAKDKAGNKTEIWTYVFTADGTAPSITDNNYCKTHESKKRLIGYTANPANPGVSTAYDNAIGDNYGSNAYTSGTIISFPEGIINASYYKFDCIADSGTPSYENTTFTWQTFENNQIALPDMTGIHNNLAIYFKDAVGNVSGVYYIARSSGGSTPERQLWWYMETANTPSILPDSSSAWAGGNKSYTLNVTYPVGTYALIKNVTAENATITNVKLKYTRDSQAKDYTSTNTSSINYIYIEGMEINIYVADGITDKDSITVSINNGIGIAVFSSNNPNINRFGNDGFTLSDGSGESAGARLVQFFNSFVSKDEEALTSTSVDNSIAEKASKTKKAAKKAKKAAKKNNKKVVSTSSTTGEAGATTAVIDSTSSKPGMAVDAAEILAQNETSSLPEITMATETAVSEIAGVAEKVSGEAEVVSIRPTGYSTTESSAATTAASADSEAQSASAPEAAADKRTPSRSASIVIMLAILSSFGAVWYLQRNRKK